MSLETILEECSQLEDEKAIKEVFEDIIEAESVERIEEFLAGIALNDNLELLQFFFKYYRYIHLLALAGPLGRCGDGGLPEVKDILIENMVDLDKLGFDGCTALHIFTTNKDQNRVRVVLARGANTEVRDSHGFTALHRAAEINSIPIASILIDRGANINITDTQGITPLHIACDLGHEIMVQLLIENEADPNIKDANGETPLFMAVDLTLDVYQMIVKEGADPFVQNNVGWTILHKIAAERPDQALAKAREIMDPALLHIRTHDTGKSALDLAIRSPYHQGFHTDLIVMMLEKGASQQIRMGRRLCPITDYLVEYTSPQTIRNCAAIGVDFTRENSIGSTCLFTAYLNDNSEMFKCLLSLGVPVYGKNKHAYFRLPNLPNRVVGILLAELASMKTRGKDIYERDIEYLKEGHPRHYNYFNDCLTDFSQMKEIMMTDTHTLLEVYLAPAYVAINRARNENFVKNLKNLDWKRFHAFRKSLRDKLAYCYTRAKRWDWLAAELSENIKQFDENGLIINKVASYLLEQEILFLRENRKEDEVLNLLRAVE